MCISKVGCRRDVVQFFSTWPTAYWEAKGNEKKAVSFTTEAADLSFIRL